MILWFTFLISCDKMIKHENQEIFLGEAADTMNDKLHDENIDFLFQAVLTLESVEECYRFFDDLCTMPELKAMSQRLAVAKMLSRKQVYSDIVAETGASTATISRVNRSLNYGSDGYELVFARLDKDSAQEE